MGAFCFYNPNPKKRRVGDCVIRAISKATDQSWKRTFIDLMSEGLKLCDMPSANNVWGSYLKEKGFSRRTLPSSYISDYTVADFADDNPVGTYILALDGHVVCVKNGCYYDSFDSGDLVPLFYWGKKFDD